jgi:hypothetical protein
MAISEACRLMALGGLPDLAHFWWPRPLAESVGNHVLRWFDCAWADEFVIAFVVNRHKIIDFGALFALLLKTYRQRGKNRYMYSIMHHFPLAALLPVRARK